ncbi:MAG: hypothetical protein ACK59M_08100 [Pseudomonadota bacterium]|jgi:hypothetical protein
MLRWILVGMAMLGFSLAFGTQSVALLAFSLLLGFGGLIGALLAFAAARMDSASQAQSSRELSLILEARKAKAVRRDGGGGASPSVEYAPIGGRGGRGKPADDDRALDSSDGGGDGGGGGGGD